MRERKRIEPTALSLQEVHWGFRRGAFENPWGRSLLRAVANGAVDQRLEMLLKEQIQPYRVQEALGEGIPFGIPFVQEGEICLGRDHRGNALSIPLQWLNAGLLLGANTGAGKTSLLDWILPQIAAQQCSVWVSDIYKRQIRHLRPLFQKSGHELVILRAQDWKVNLLHPGDVSLSIHITMVVDLLTRTLELPQRSSYILRQACQDLYDQYAGSRDSGVFPCLYDLYEWIRKAKGLNAAAREAILDRLGTLLVSLTPGCAAYRKGWTPRELSQFSICFEFQGASEYQKQILLESLLFGLLQAEVSSGSVNKPMDLFSVFEDGQRLFQEKNPWSGELAPLDELAGVVRGSGKGLGIIVQTLQGLSRRIFPNMATKMMGRLGSFEDYKRLGADLGMTWEQIDWARKNLSPGSFICQLSEGEWREPFLLQVPFVEVPLVVEDADVSQSLRPLESIPVIAAPEYQDWKPSHLHWARSTADLHGTGDLGKETTESNRIDIQKDTLDYLQAVAEHPFLNTSERDRQLGMSAWRGHRIRKELAESGWGVPVAINPGGRGKKFQLLEITAKGRELLKAYGIPLPSGHGRGGLEHQWWCQWIAKWLKSRGIDAVIEDESQGARVDISIQLENGLRMAIEVEVSEGHELENIRKDLEAGFVKVVSLVKATTRVGKLRKALREALLKDQGQYVKVGVLGQFESVLGEALNSKCGGGSDGISKT